MHVLRPLLVLSTCMYSSLAQDVTTSAVTVPTTGAQTHFLYPEIQLGKRGFRISKVLANQKRAIAICNNDEMRLLDLTDKARAIVTKVLKLSGFPENLAETYGPFLTSDTETVDGKTKVLGIDLNGKVKPVDDKDKHLFLCERGQCKVYPINYNLVNITYEGVRYRYDAVVATYPSANIVCEKQDIELMRTPNETERNKALEIMKLSPYPDVPIWIALTRNSEGKFMWSNNDPLTYTSWADGEPKKDKKKECVQMDPKGKWRIEHCVYNSTHFIAVPLKEDCVEPNDIDAGVDLAINDDVNVKADAGVKTNGDVDAKADANAGGTKVGT